MYIVAVQGGEGRVKPRPIKWEELLQKKYGINGYLCNWGRGVQCQPATDLERV